MSQNNNSKFQYNITKRNYNNMISNPIYSTIDNNSFSQNEIFKSALKFGGPINQDLIIHHKKNIRKSMGYAITKEKMNFDLNDFEEKKNREADKINEIYKTKEKKEIINSNMNNSPKKNIFNNEEKNNFNRTIYKDNNKQTLFSNLNYDKIKDNNKDVFNSKSEIKKKNYESFLSNFNKEKNDLNNDNNLPITNPTLKEEKEKSQSKDKDIKNNNSSENKNNPFININNNNNKINPFITNNNSCFTKSNEIKIDHNENKDSNKNICENPFLAIKNPFKLNTLSVNNTNDNISNPFSFNNNNLNPFKSNNNKNTKNPFLNNPVNNNDNNTKKDIKFENPFLSNLKTNPFLSNTKDINQKDNINIFNPFVNIANPFNELQKDNNNNNSNNNNNNKIINPFLSIKNTSNNHYNPFLSNVNNPFDFMNNFNNVNQTSNNDNNNNPFKNKSEAKNKEDENLNIEEEVRIEKDEDKLKTFKEIKYEKENKFYETEIENLQYFYRDNEKNKYISIGPGMLSFQVENNEGKKSGIFVLRDLNTKNIKIQGMFINKSEVEKNKLKNGPEFILIKNVLASYPKYTEAKIETKLTYIRIKVNNNNLETLFNKAKEFLELMKK